MIKKQLIYRPPSEFDSLIIQATVGCPHNKCEFCNLYRDRKFKIKPVSEIINELEKGKIKFRGEVKKIFLCDGNTVLMKTEELLKILKYCKRIFPNLERITMYGSAQYINLKSVEEFKKLKKAGLTRIHCGMESGDDDVLSSMNKGYNSKEMIKAGKLLKKAGIELSLYYIVGLGGKKLSDKHAKNSAKVINEINPDFIRLRTLIPFEKTPLFKKYINKEFTLLNPHEALKETKIFINNLKNIKSEIYSNHVSNYCKVNGKIPYDKNKIIKKLNEYLNFDLSDFRAPDKGVL